MFKFPKIKKKISNKELRNLDYTIIDWLVSRLKAFKKQTTNYPYDSTLECARSLPDFPLRAFGDPWQWHA